MSKATPASLLRLLDANANRLREGLRVCEDALRFVYDQKTLTSRLKRLRHQVTELLLQDQAFSSGQALAQRRVNSDVGRTTIDSELQRTDTVQILAANLQRAKESIRVLEEFAKLRQPVQSESWKRLRYELYALEQRILQAVRNSTGRRKGK